MKRLLQSKIDNVLRLMNITSSKDLKNQKFIMIASRKASQKELLFKENEFDAWKTCYDTINGFVYEDGYEYELLISIKKSSNMNIGKDTSLIRILTKTKKESYDLPN
ncbi:protein of unknown function [Tenacibaculum sp. MAR_2009_124]|uniref:DUF4377 domain-containing protein n=1 Tax=Tenacibaculum sp. MAR_2009_124 TaxID=1250059 RepID=UPI0008973FFD|nr:DUF4377 domain-containing protein [Tenacibaculum sp. MAR_2009_124]SEC48137.1 protein of unknown function [Tenacibaculum sp. MAR_2009_124]